MFRKNFIALFLVFVLSFAIPSFAQAATTATVKTPAKDGSLNVRSGPGIKYAVAGWVKNGYEIQVLADGAWSKIKVIKTGKVGYIRNIYIVKSSQQLEQKISFFYPNINDGKIYYKEKLVSFKKNDIVRQVIEKAYKETVSEDLGSVFSPNTKINSLYLNKDGMVYIDLNSAFLKEMNAGAQYEGMILQSIANTFGKYYDAKKVILTIDNKLYESGHFAFQKFESLKVNLKDTIQIK